MSEATNGERLAALKQALDSMEDTLLLHIRSLEDRLIARIEATIRRVDALEVAHNGFRDSFHDENGVVTGRAVMNRIVAVEKTINGYNRIANMGRGVFLLAGFVLLMAAKSIWEALEWVLKWGKT
jgi:hypothetical protein